MSSRVRLQDLGRMGDEARDAAFAGLLNGARQGDPAGSAMVQARIREYEIRYEMSSAELTRRLRDGQQKETAEIARWLVLLAVRDSDVRA